MTSFDPEYLARFGHPFKGWDDPRPTKQCLHCHGTGKADEHNDCGFCFRAPEPGDTVADDTHLPFPKPKNEAQAELLREMVRDLIPDHVIYQRIKEARRG